MSSEQEWRDVHDRLFRDFGEGAWKWLTLNNGPISEYINTTEEAAAWDRANPDTCRHHVVVRAAGYPVNGLSLWGCVSCKKLVPSDITDKRNYEFDVDHNVYVHDPYWGHLCSRGHYERLLVSKHPNYCPECGKER